MFGIANCVRESAKLLIARSSVVKQRQIWTDRCYLDGLSPASELDLRCQTPVVVMTVMMVNLGVQQLRLSVILFEERFPSPRWQRVHRILGQRLQRATTVSFQAASVEWSRSSHCLANVHVYGQC